MIDLDAAMGKGDNSHIVEMLATKARCRVGGGVRTAEEAAQYLALAADIMGPQWVTPEHFRFGASSLLNNLLNTLNGNADAATNGGY